MPLEMVPCSTRDWVPTRFGDGLTQLGGGTLRPGMDAASEVLIRQRLRQITSALDRARSPDVLRLLRELQREHEAALIPVGAARMSPTPDEFDVTQPGEEKPPPTVETAEVAEHEELTSSSDDDFLELR